MKKHYNTFIICFTALLIAALVMIVLTRYDVFTSKASRWEKEIKTYSEKYSLDPALIKAIIRVESNFKPDAKSSANAYGLMQVTEETLRWIMMHEGDNAYYEAEDLFDPDINIHYGCAILARLLNEFEDLDTVLAAYNAGRSNAIKWLKDARFSDDGVHIKRTPFYETDQYIEKVHYFYKKYKGR